MKREPFLIHLTESKKEAGWRLAIWTILWTFCVVCCQAQAVPGKQVVATIQQDPWHTQQTWVYTPPDYAASNPCTTAKQIFPLVIYLAGIGDWSSMAAVLQNGPGHIIATSGWLPECILLSPLWNGGWSNPQAVNADINWAEQHFQVDTTRIYLIGISAGGGGCYNYICTNQYFMSRIAAMVPMSASAVDDIQTGRYTSDSLKYCAKFGLHVWDFCGNKDNLGFLPINEMYVNKINAAAPGYAKITVYPGTHCCWLTYWNPNYTEGGLNWFDWLMQFHK